MVKRPRKTSGEHPGEGMGVACGSHLRMRTVSRRVFDPCIVFIYPDVFVYMIHRYWLRVPVDK